MSIPRDLVIPTVSRAVRGAVTIADLKPYPRMKDSGVSWLGGIPASWSVVRNGRIFVERKETGFADLPILEVSLRSGVRVRRLDSDARKQLMSDRDKYKRACAGDLAYNMMRMWQGAVGLAPVDGLVSPAYVVARPFAGVVAHYFAYLFRTDSYMGEVDQYSRGIVKDRNRLYWDQFKQMPSARPPTEEQAAIVCFLGHADRQISRYIRAKQKLIKVLEEQKRTIIHRAVTRGLDPNIRLKPSGEELLGELPEHWEVRRLKTLVRRIDQGVSPEADNYLADDGSWGVLKAGCVNHGLFKEYEHKRLPARFAFDPSLAVAVGDTLVSRASGSPHLVGSAGRVQSLAYRLILSDKIFRPVFNESVDSDFMILTMNSRYYRQQVEQAISGAEGLANNLPLSSLRAFVFAVPPKEEQSRIIESVSSSTNRLAETVRRAEQEILLLREYRSRLIADVVTGKLDVREAAAMLTDDADEPEPLDDTAAVDTDEAVDDVDNGAAPEEDEA